MSEQFIDEWSSYEAWIEQGGMPMAFAGGDDEAAIRREVMHYAAVYSQDGPVTVHGPMLVTWRIEGDGEPTPISPPQYVEKFGPSPTLRGRG